jgi:hypothetical protein
MELNAPTRATPFFGALPMKLSKVSWFLIGFIVIASSSPVLAEPPASKDPSTSTESKAKAKWQSLFDGKSLEGWKPVNFGGEGEVTAENGTIVLNIGSPMTGITYQRPFPKMAYEVRCEAKRADGHDFFCGMTFPVADSHCTLIAGGWGGAIVGLSSINGHDASENDTTKYMKFDNDHWHKFRVRVTPNRIQAWIDEDRVIDSDITGCKISTRFEVDLNKPFGFASYETKAVLRNIEVRQIAEVEKENEIADREAKRLSEKKK